MKANFLLNCRRGLVLFAVVGRQAALAQGPTIDPAFQQTTVFKPASVFQAVQQPDGKRLVLGAFQRAGREPAGPLVRLLANSNEPDSAFTSNVRGLQGRPRFVVLMPSGKVLVVGYNQIALGAVVREQLLLLNADGTPDTGFNANIPVGTGFGSNPVVSAVGQPDGKLVLVCTNALVAGAGPLVRLLPTGAVDAAFQAALSGSAPGLVRLGSNVVLQADGKLVVPGNFANRGVARLLPTGALDPAFTAQLPVSPTYLASQVAVQPDGKVLVTTIDNSTGTRQPLLRLTTAGAVDPAFQSAITGSFSPAGTQVQVQVQPDGKILVSTYNTYAAGTLVGPLVRLLPGGGLDSAFDATAALGISISTIAQLLPNGQLLAVKTTRYVYGAAQYRLVLLNADGSLDPSLRPRLYAAGQVNDVVQLPGGGYLVGGDFTEINGVAVGYLARLGASGVPDPSFVAAADDEVRTVLVQPDGKLLVGGAFERIAGGSRVSLARLLPSGVLDAGFAPPFLPTAFSPGGGIGRVGLLPDGRVVAAGGTRLTGTGAVEPWLRVLDAATGQPDLSWPRYRATDFVVQPGGKVVVAGFDTIGTGNASRGSCLFRLLPSGLLDPAFTPLPTFRTGFGGGPVVTALAQSATGSLFLTGYNYIDAGPPAPPRLYALQPNGQRIADVANSNLARVVALAAQPNGRLLVGTDIGATAAPFYGLSRLLSTLAPDPGFLSANGPLATVNRLLVQPDGAIVAAGTFTGVGGQAICGLTRLLDANVLGVAAAQRPAEALTQAWPVPAHGRLHLALDAAARPRRVELLDALGRVVLSQAVGQPDMTLDTAGRPAGTYLLRVQYAGGPVSRRVVLD